ncbi:PREDICTED: DDT domain-containing protein DDR4-like [Camelina sativa]|uniref:DDT domain-containing protein DDR4-like n=2 Tax=Camelina sativa TaxID=90675 RepID=A0ABM0T633_CAMSA|nr:PREDICTED: DDT domain-containing protein DDR4-like [Camelina sativa]
MVKLRPRTAVVTEAPEPKLEEERICEDLMILSDDSDDNDSSSSDSAVKHLRGRWELASVLNFLNVFEPLVSEKLKLTAEEIEMGLIESNNTNAQLHIALLKGIPPVNKNIDDENAWITVLCKKLSPWWPWIATGEIPLTANKGKEISEYQGLNPINRLKFLKALCELRVQQDDVRSYIQENTKEEDLDSHFRKRKLGGDGKKTSYWFDGNDMQGYRLYREVNEISKKNAFSDKSCLSWEIEATNLDEFQRVARELSSSKTSPLAATGEMIETEAIPVVEKYHKKKERALKKKMKLEKVVNVNFSRPMRITRSCRNRMPATYTFDDYDKMISDAVEEREETDKDEVEGREQQSASLGSNESSEGNKKKLTEDEEPEINKEDEAPEITNDDEKENEKSKEDAESKGEYGVKNRLRQRVTRNSALC